MQGYQAEGHTLACIEESVSADAISPKPGEDTNVEGNLEDLLKGEGKCYTFNAKVEQKFQKNILFQ
ncbi:MAG: hypothetical protein ACLTTJ_08175 [Blautia sp.]